MIPYFMTKTPQENKHIDNQTFKTGRLLSQLKDHSANCWKAKKIRETLDIGGSST